MRQLFLIALIIATFGACKKETPQPLAAPVYTGVDTGYISVAMNGRPTNFRWPKSNTFDTVNKILIIKKSILKDSGQVSMSFQVNLDTIHLPYTFIASSAGSSASLSLQAANTTYEGTTYNGSIYGGLITVTISSVASGKIQGTFSGTIKCVNGCNGANSSYQLSQGTINCPYIRN